jgi:hypothetical protein
VLPAAAKETHFEKNLETLRLEIVAENFCAEWSA